MIKKLTVAKLNTNERLEKEVPEEIQQFVTDSESLKRFVTSWYVVKRGAPFDFVADCVLNNRAHLIDRRYLKIYSPSFLYFCWFWIFIPTRKYRCIIFDQGYIVQELVR